MHGRPRLSRHLLAAAVAAALAVTAGAVAWRAWPDGAVEVAPAAASAHPTCTRLAARLPAQVAGQRRRATSPSTPSVAAWGEPSVVWRCGVSPPGPTTDQCLDVDGVDWVVRELDDGTAFTTYGREPAVQVLVPREYAPEPLALPPLSRVVAAVPQGPRRCS